MRIKNKNLPKGWVHTQLGELGLLINGDRGKNYPNKKALVESGIPFINAGHIQDGIINLSEMNYVTEERFNLLGSGKVKSNDILYCLRGSLGKTAIVKNITTGAIASSLVIIRPYDFSKEKYLYYFLVSPFGDAEIRKHDNGSAQPNLSAKSLRSYSIPLPPLNEQKRIVTKIETLQTRSTAVKEELEAIKPLLNQFRQSVLASAFRGDLTKDWREQNPDVEPAEVLLERIRIERRRRWEQAELEKMKAKGKIPKDDKWKKKYKEPEPNDSDGLSELPDSWCWVRAEEICDFITKGTTPSKQEMFEGYGEIPYIKVYNLTDTGTLDFSINPTFINHETHNGKLARSRLFPGDILMNIVGPPLGKVSIVPDSYPEWNMNQAIAVYRAILGIDNLFLCYCLLSTETLYFAVSMAKATAGQFNLTLEICRNLPVPIPPLKEQKEIVCRIESLFKLADSIEQQYQQAEVDLETLNQSILAKAFRGELVPQDPNDEPASVLLERIKEEREKEITAKKSKTKKKRGSKKKDEQLGIPGM